MTFAEIANICPAGMDAQACHDFLAKKLVSLCQLESLLKSEALPICGNSVCHDEAYTDELMLFHEELAAMSGCLEYMISMVRTQNGFSTPYITTEELNTIQRYMIHEARRAHHDARYTKDIPDQIVSLFVDVTRFVAHVTLKRLVQIGASTDFAGTVRGIIGPVEVKLCKPEWDEASPLSSNIRQAFQRVNQARRDVRAAPSDTLALHGQGAAMVPVANSSSAAQQAPKSALSKPLQELGRQAEQARVPRIAAYKKAIQVTLERQGKTNTVERVVPAEVKTLIEQHGGSAQLFVHEESTPIAHEIIEDAYRNIVDLNNVLITAPAGGLPGPQTDLVMTAVGLSVAAADNAHKGNYDEALAQQQLAYATRCATEFVEYTGKGGLDVINPVTYAQAMVGIVQVGLMCGLHEEYANLALVSALAKRLGFLKPETIQIIDQACEQYNYKQKLVVDELIWSIRADIAHNFKDGVVLGLCRFGGYTLGNFLAPVALKSGLASVGAKLASLKGLKAFTYAELEEINLQRQLARQNILENLAKAEPSLKEAIARGEIPETVTPEGLRIRFAPVEGEAPAAAYMEGEAARTGAAKVAPIAESALKEVAKDLKCEESAALRQMKEYFSKGVVIENRVEAAIDADTKIVFRKDFGEYAHPLKTKRGYPAGARINHYNIDICKKTRPGTTIDRWDNVEVYHIVFDAEGKDIIDFFK